MLGKNIAVIYGGGQIPSGNEVIGRLIEKLLKRTDLTVYGVHKSFWGLSDPECYEKFTISKAKAIQSQIGTYLSTCRDVNPADDRWFYQIISCLKEKEIRTIVIPGGDGSSRAGNVLLQRAKSEGYDLQIIFIPCTIDGIEGSQTTLGIDSAVAESYRQTSLIVANAFATYNPNFIGPRISINEIQGRNRNDIAVGVMDKVIQIGKIGKYYLDDITLIFVPTGYNWSYNKLIKSITSTDKEVSIIISEGAKPNEIYWEQTLTTGNGIGERIANEIRAWGQREVNLNKVGYLSQANDQISVEEKEKIQDWICYAIKILNETNESVAIIKKDNKFDSVSLKDFAEATDSDSAVSLSKEELERFSRFLP